MTDIYCNPVPDNVKNILHEKFGKLTVVGFAYTKRKKSYWHCKCDCGGTSIVRISRLTSGETTACGCMKGRCRDSHHLSKHPLFSLWMGIRQRTLSPKSRQWKDYGERGITLCEGWQNFVNFVADMDNRPSPLHTVDRIDNDKSYSCGKCEQCVLNNWTMNCRWATASQQNSNTRATVNLTYQGKTQCLNHWAYELDMNVSTIHQRLARGWTVEQSLSTPALKPTQRRQRRPWFS